MNQTTTVVFCGYFMSSMANGGAEPNIPVVLALFGFGSRNTIMRQITKQMDLPSSTLPLPTLSLLKISPHNDNCFLISAYKNVNLVYREEYTRLQTTTEA
jgi:hypothetical protein